MEKVIVFTHGIDIDGFGGAILSKLAFNNPKIIFAENFNLDELFLKNVSSDHYDKIYIVDHCLSFQQCENVSKNPELRNKIKIFDHHKSRLGKEDQFDFVKLVVEDENGLQSGTSIFYNFLVTQGLIKPNNALAEFVKLTTLYDTWEWKNNQLLGQSAFKLNVFFQAIGREEYINTVLNILEKNSNSFTLGTNENKIINNFIQTFNKKVKNYINKIKVIELDGLRVGFVEIEDLYKNDIAERLRSLKNPLNIDYLMMPLTDRGTVSLRHIENVDLAEIAQKFNGGGHKYAASFQQSNPRFKNLLTKIKNQNIKAIEK